MKQSFFTKEIELVSAYLKALQEDVISKIEAQESQCFQIDNWDRLGGGGGRSAILSEGQIFEQAAVHFSHISGENLPKSVIAQKPQYEGIPFQALGVSVVLHPVNPFVPSTHANVRFFAVDTPGKTEWWFAGGYDLTPYYAFEEDCILWHTTAFEACKPFGASLYHEWKNACDAYFYLPHRNEARGIGGIFFDDVNQKPFPFCFDLWKAVGNSFWKAYSVILDRRKQMVYSDNHRAFQLYRRGRYVEFNLLYDRGTLFGLQSGGRTESILASLPPLVRWKSHWNYEKGSPEEQLINFFLKPQDWVTM